MRTINVISVIAALIALIALLYIIMQYMYYIKVIKLYNSSDYYRQYLKRQIQSFYPLVPKWGSKRYIGIGRIITEAGWGLSVEEIYIIKYLLLIVTFVLLVGIKATNLSLDIEGIKENMHYKKVVMDTLTKDTKENTLKEKRLVEYFYEDAKEKNVFSLANSADEFPEYIVNMLKQKGWGYPDEDTETTAWKIYYKIMDIYHAENSKSSYMVILIASIAAFHIPESVAKLKIKLIAEKKNWEVNNLAIVYSVFGCMPPYSVENIIDNMVMAADVFKNTIIRLRDGIKDAKGEHIYSEILEQVENEELYELIENMQFNSEIGLVNTIKNIDEMIEHNIENIKVMNIYRRDSKNLYSMIPAVIVLTIALLYAAYGIVPLANPMQAMKLLNQ